MLICVQSDCVISDIRDFRNYVDDLMENKVYITYDGFDIIFFDKETSARIDGIVRSKMEEELHRQIRDILYNQRKNEVIIIFDIPGGMM